MTCTAHLNELGGITFTGATTHMSPVLSKGDPGRPTAALRDLERARNDIERWLRVSAPSPDLIARLDAPPRATLDWSSVPSALREAAMPHQRSSMERAIEWGGRAIIALEPGLGKTMVACGLVHHYAHLYVGKALIVVPSNKISDWIDEMKQWVGIEAGVCRRIADSLPDAEVVIASYDVATENVAIRATEWTTVVADESHLLKSAESKRSLAICSMAKRAKHALMLSGTPEVSRPSELWTTLDVVAPGEWGTRREFEVRYCEGHEGKYGFEARGHDPMTAYELHLLLGVCMIRVLKRDVLSHLPPKTIRRIEIEIDDAAATRMVELRREAKALRDAATTEWQKHSADAKIGEMWRLSGVAKLPGVAAWLRANLGTGKMAVFAHHACIEDELGKIADSMGIKWFRLDGSTPPKKRDAYIKSFRSATDTTYQLGIMSIKAAGVGINLVPGVFRIAFAELQWCAPDLSQAEDRVHRIGCKHPVEIYYLVSRRSYDCEMLRVLDSKSSTNAAVLDDEIAEPKFKRVRT